MDMRVRPAIVQWVYNDDEKKMANTLMVNFTGAQSTRQWSQEAKFGGFSRGAARIIGLNFLL